MQFLTRSNPVRVYAERISGNNKTSLNSDNLTITLKFEEGSVGNIVYSASGDRASSRERVEIYCEGKTLVIDDYRRSHFYSSGKKKTFRTANQQIGYDEELRHFFDVASDRRSPILTPQEFFMSTLTVFNVNKSLEKGLPVEILP